MSDLTGGNKTPEQGNYIPYKPVGTFTPFSTLTGQESTAAKVGKEIKNSPAIVQNEILRLQNKILGDLVPLTIEFRDLSHLSAEFQEKGVSMSLQALLESAEEEIVTILGDISADPDEEKLTILNEKIEKFKEILGEAKSEVEKNEEGEAEKNNLEKGVADLTTQYEDLKARAAILLSQLTDQDVKNTLESWNTGVASLVTSLKNTPSEELRAAAQERINEYAKFIADTQAFVVDATLEQEVNGLVTQFDDLKQHAHFLLPKIKDPDVKNTLESFSLEIASLVTSLKNTPSEKLKNAVQERVNDYNNFIADIQSFVDGATLEQEQNKKEQEVQAELHKELVEIVSESERYLSKAPGLEMQIKDQSVQDLFIQVTQDIRNELEQLKQNLSRKSIDAFKLRLEDYILTLDSIEKNIAQRKTEEELDVFGMWPSNIYKENSKNKKGWVFSYGKDNQESLPTEEWDKAYANIPLVFADYKAFMLEGGDKARATKKKLFKSLIDAKNTIITTLLAKDPIKAHTLSEQLAVLLAEKKKEWEALEGGISLLSHHKERFELEVDKASHLPKAVREHLKEQEASIQAMITSINTRYTEGKTALPNAFKELDEAISKYRYRSNYYTENALTSDRPSETIRDAAINGVWVKDYKTGQKKLVGFMKDTPTSTVGMSDEEKNKLIKVIGRPPMRNEDYINEQNAKKREANTVTLTDELLDEWPEIAAAYQNVGDKISKEEFATLTTKALYERQYDRDQNDFLRRFTVPSLDEKTNTVRYVESDLLKSQTKKAYEAIKELLQAKGIFVDIKNDAEIEEDKKKDHKEKELWRMRHSITLHPRLKKAKTLFSKGDEGYRLGGYDPGVTMKQAPESLDSSEARYQKLKRQRSKYLDPAVGYRFTPLEQELDEKLAKAKKEQQDAGKDKKNWSTKYKLHSFQKALDAYEKDAKPLIEGKIAEKKLPDTQIERQKRQDAIKRVNEILNIREKNLVKKPQYIRNYKLFCLALALALPPAALVGYKQAEAERGDAAVAAALQNTPTIQTNKIDKQEVTKTPKNPWKEFFSTNDPANKEFPDKILSIPDEGDARQQAIEQLTSSKVPEFMTSGDKSAIRTLLSLDADKIKNSKDHIPEFKTDKARIQAYEFVLLLEKLSQAIDNEAQVKAQAEGKIYIAPSDTWYTSPKESLNSFIDRIQKKAKANS